MLKTSYNKMTYSEKENYCTLSPEKLFGVKFNYACYLHDRQYRNEVKNRKTRKEADLDLKDRIFKAFELKNKKIEGFIVSWVYYVAVRIMGFFVWDDENPNIAGLTFPL